jgi:hypothetical protein
VPAHAGLRSLAHGRSDVAVRSLDKLSGDTRGGAMRRRSSSDNTKVTNSQLTSPKILRGSRKIAGLSLPKRFRHGSTELPSHFHTLPRRI